MKCDACGFEVEQREGFVLTSSEVTASSRYWENQLPKFAIGVAAFQNVQDKTSFVVERMAEYVYDPSGWLICEPCSLLFQFDRDSARCCAMEGQDRPDAGPADLETAVIAARDAIECLCREVEPGGEGDPVATKAHWQCTRCGALYVKDPDGRATSELVLEAGGMISGGITCADCRTRYSMADVYSGRFDMREDDALVAAAISDPGNVTSDPVTKTWYYKGLPLKGPSPANAPRSRWWQFWR